MSHTLTHGARRQRTARPVPPPRPMRRPTTGKQGAPAALCWPCERQCRGAATCSWLRRSSRTPYYYTDSSRVSPALRKYRLYLPSRTPREGRSPGPAARGNMDARLPTPTSRPLSLPSPSPPMDDPILSSIVFAQPGGLGGEIRFRLSVASLISAMLPLVRQAGSVPMCLALHLAMREVWHTDLRGVRDYGDAFMCMTYAQVVVTVVVHIMKLRPCTETWCLEVQPQGRAHLFAMGLDARPVQACIGSGYLCVGVPCGCLAWSGRGESATHGHHGALFCSCPFSLLSLAPTLCVCCALCRGSARRGPSLSSSLRPPTPPPKGCRPLCRVMYDPWCLVLLGCRCCWFKLLLWQPLPLLLILALRPPPRPALPRSERRPRRAHRVVSQRYLCCRHGRP